MLTINEHSLRYVRLKKADAQVRAKHGANHTLGLPSEWSPTPRAGARWSAQECEALVSAIETYYKVRNQPLRARRGQSTSTPSQHEGLTPK